LASFEGSSVLAGIIPAIAYAVHVDVRNDGTDTEIVGSFEEGAAGV
jgi:hypothetical protein